LTVTAGKTQAVMTIEPDPVPPDPDAEPKLSAAFLAASSLIGVLGRMISGSKGGFREDPRTRDHAVVFNGNLSLTEGKFWHGDLDLSVEERPLRELARVLDADVFVLYERDARFDTARSPRLAQAVAIFHPDGSVTLNERAVHRNADGLIKHGPEGRS
jgi:hypothetical protein